MSDESQIVINRLKGHIESLISSYEVTLFEKRELEQKLAATSEKLATTQQDLEKSKKTVKELGEKIDILQLANGFRGSAQDVKEAKQRIARLVREIDKCISLLND